MAAPLRVLWALTCCFLLQTHLCTGQSLWSPRAVVASVGDEVVLPCLFLPPRDVSGQTLQWTRPDLDPRFVFVWRSYKELTAVKNPAFAGRSTLFTDELTHGNISLKLTSVGIRDHGTYRCSMPALEINSTVRLHVDDAFRARVLPVVVALAVAATASVGFVIVLLFLVCKRRRQNVRKLEDLRTEVDKLKKELEIHEKKRQKELSERKPVIIDSFDSSGHSFSLKNNSGQDQEMKDWTVYIEIDDDPALIYEFKYYLSLRSGKEEATVTVWAEGWFPENVDGLRHKEWKNQLPWNTGETALVSLYNEDKQLVDVICVRMFPPKPK